jgi:hypothetical protein
VEHEQSSLRIYTVGGTGALGSHRPGNAAEDGVRGSDREGEASSECDCGITVGRARFFESDAERTMISRSASSRFFPLSLARISSTWATFVGKSALNARASAGKGRATGRPWLSCE